MPATTPAPRVAVLVLNFNGRRFLDQCFRSVFQNPAPPFDLFLIDNHSTDDSLKFTQTRFPGVNIVKNEANLGYAGAYDRIIRELDHDYVVLLNNDTAVAPGWLGALYGAAAASPRVAACGPRILMMDHPHILDHGGGLLTIIGSGRDLGKWQRDPGPDAGVREVGFASGCSLFLRRAAYLEVGGFDPDYFMYHEDVDLCWRLRLAGYSVRYVPEAVVHHHLGGSVSRDHENPNKLYWCQKNRLANMVKNLGPGRLTIACGVSLAYDALRLLRFLAQGNVELAQLLLRGYAATCGRWRVLLRQRRQVQRQRTVSDRELAPFFSPVLAAAKDYLRLTAIKDLPLPPAPHL
jgi:GT2 family glycosyltransferase